MENPERHDAAKRRDLSIRGKTVWAIICFERYVLKEYPDRDMKPVARMMWNIVRGKRFFEDRHYKYAEFLANVLSSGNAYDNRQLNRLNMEHFDAFKKALPHPKDDPDLFRILKLIRDIPRSGWSLFERVEGDAVADGLLEVEEILVRREVEVPDVCELPRFLDRSYVWGSSFEAKDLSLILGDKPPKKRPKIRNAGWNPFMVEGAEFGELDIPFCPTTATDVPEELITYSEAKEIWKKERKSNPKFRRNAFVCFYEHDCKFDSPRCGIWVNYRTARAVLRHFAGIITPDFSTYQDFPIPWKTVNTYKMRAFGHWWGAILGMPVINNVRWGTPETWSYCFEGIPKKSIVAIGTVGGSPRKSEDRERFEEGLRKMISVLEPHTIIVCGGAKYKYFDAVREQGIRVVAYPSKTRRAFAAAVEKKKAKEQDGKGNGEE